MTNPFPKSAKGYSNPWVKTPARVIPAAPVWQKYPGRSVAPPQPAGMLRSHPQVSVQRSPWPAPMPPVVRSAPAPVPFKPVPVKPVHAASPKAFQPKSGPPAASAAVQRYVKQKNGVLWSYWSDNSYYYLPARGGDHMWARNDKAPPRASKPTGNNIVIHGHQYDEYRSRYMLTDCLHTAEEIMANGTLGYAQGVYSETADMLQDPFGQTDAKNRKLAKARAALGTSNAAADPNVGEAFVIVRKNPPAANKSPYHAAAVVAADGTDRFTLEQSAGGVDAHKRALALGMYDVYSVGDVSGQSFHTRHSGVYNDGVTFVIQNNGTAKVKTFANRDAWRAKNKKTAAGKF